MTIFIDTAAFLAVLNANGRFHAAARQVWQEILLAGSVLFREQGFELIPASPAPEA
jgi:predicted nucleic acid-binding protein